MTCFFKGAIMNSPGHFGVCNTSAAPHCWSRKLENFAKLVCQIWLEIKKQSSTIIIKPFENIKHHQKSSNYHQKSSQIIKPTKCLTEVRVFWNPDRRSPFLTQRQAVSQSQLHASICKVLWIVLWKWNPTVDGSEIRLTPVEVGTWNPIF